MKPLPPPSERGVALAITLIILVIISLLSVSSVRTTSLQERMSGNLRDREISFQHAESILRLAETAVQNAPTFAAHGGLDCSDTAPPCPSDPLAVPAANWRNLVTNVPANNQVGTAQYLVQYMGFAQENDPNNLGQNQSANNNQYGSNNNSAPLSDVFRITVRNSNDQAAGRSLVVLQSTIRIRR